ncbi:hypothetical protein THRCLA_07559 [Thraustotheca clavata]|uniref:Transmembrane protein n=1 Tax=Thraustotheca clavata TaxID=74557 RepID=A0A1V9ZD14_9STRA|nr:hypothetical protein THRCLA_07559 [Thraustotheca clavata]
MTGTVVKLKSFGLLGSCFRKYGIRSKFNKILVLCAYIIGAAVVVLVAIDSVMNNWAFTDFIGNGYDFVTPVANVANAADLGNHYIFQQNYDVQSLSEMGAWMINYSVSSLGGLESNIYVVDAGTYIATADNDNCKKFSGTYPVDLAKKNVFKLALTYDSVSFIRGDAISIAFSDTSTVNLANSSMKSAQMYDLGYTPTRIQSDVRMTHKLKVQNTTSKQIQIVPFYRIYTKSFCTGCVPMAMLGHSSCNFSMVYNDTTKQLKVTSTIPSDTPYRVGMMLTRNFFTGASQIIKYLALMFALGGYLASRRTVQWVENDPTKPTTIIEQIVQAVAPKCFPHRSHALRFDMFCYNSDIFVIFFCISIILDVKHSLMFIREVNAYNAATPELFMTVRLFALSLRMLWINCGVLKLAKFVWYILGGATYCGESRLMGFLNLSSVTSLYLSAILLFYLPAYLEYNNSVRQDLPSSVESLDGIPVNFYESFFFRVSYAVAVGVIVNMLLVTLLDQVGNRSSWVLMSKNSLVRQAMYNSTSILCDYISDIDNTSTSEQVTLTCKARRLSTLQWFFMSHMVTFGLPEKEARAKKYRASTQTVARTGSTSTEQAGAQGQELCMVIQDNAHFFHLVDENFADIQSLVYNIKVLKDTAVVIK